MIYQKMVNKSGYRSSRKPHKLKKRKTIFKNRIFWLILLILIILCGVFYLICFNSFFQIKKIEIIGNEKISSQKIHDLTFEKIYQKILLFPTKSIFFVNLKEIENNILEKEILIDKVNLKRKFPDKIEIRINEKKPFAIFVQNENNFLIDKNGIVFEKYKNIEENQNLIKIQNLIFYSNVKVGDKVIEKKQMEQILYIKDNLGFIQIVEVILASEQRLNVRTVENWEVYFNLKQNLDWQITKLKSILDQKIPTEKRNKLKYIDLRFEKVYISPEIGI